MAEFCGAQDFQSEQHYTALRRDGNCLPRSERNMWDGDGKVWNFGSVAIAACVAVSGCAGTCGGLAIAKEKAPTLGSAEAGVLEN